MGKFSNNRKLKKHRYNPTSREDDGKAKEKKPAPPVVGRLKSAKPEDRREACLDVCSMAAEHDQLQQLVLHDVHIHVSLLLTDPDDKVAAVAAGALKNMLITADTFEEDVFEPLLGPANVMALVDSVCHTLETRWSAGASGDPLLELTAQMLQLLALLLSKEQAAMIFAEDPVRVSFLMSCLDRPSPVPFYAAHCLLILSEENVDWRSRAEGFAPMRRFLTDATTPPLRVTCAGVLLNLHCEVEDVQSLLPSVLEGLNLHLREKIINVLEQMRQDGFDMDAFESAKQSWLIDTKTFTTACEILANLIPYLEESIDEEEEHDEAELARLEEENFVQSDVGKLLMDNSVNLVAMVCDKVEEFFDGHERSNEALGNDSDMEAAFKAAQGALLALFIDLMLVVPYPCFAHRVRELWRVLYTDFTMRCAAAGSTWLQDDRSFLVHALWVLLSKDRRQEEAHRLITEADAKPLCTACAQLLSSSPTEGIPARLLDLLGQGAQYVNDMAINRDIGQLLLQRLAAETCASHAAAALNALIDVYSDERFDGNVKAMGLVPALKKLQGKFVHIVKNLKEEEEEDEELMGRLAMLQDNLPSFIAYKQSHGC